MMQASVKRIARVMIQDRSRLCPEQLRGLPVVDQGRRVVIHVPLYQSCPLMQARGSIQGALDDSLHDAQEYVFLNWWN